MILKEPVGNTCNIPVHNYFDVLGQRITEKYRTMYVTISGLNLFLMVLGMPDIFLEITNFYSQVSNLVNREFGLFQNKFLCEDRNENMLHISQNQIHLPQVLEKIKGQRANAGEGISESLGMVSDLVSFYLDFSVKKILETSVGMLISVGNESNSCVTNLMPRQPAVEYLTYREKILGELPGRIMKWENRLKNSHRKTSLYRESFTKFKEEIILQTDSMTEYLASNIWKFESLINLKVDTILQSENQMNPQGNLVLQTENMGEQQINMILQSKSVKSQQDNMIPQSKNLIDRKADTALQIENVENQQTNTILRSDSVKHMRGNTTLQSESFKYLQRNTVLQIQNLTETNNNIALQNNCQVVSQGNIIQHRESLTGLKSHSIMHSESLINPNKNFILQAENLISPQKKIITRDESKEKSEDTVIMQEKLIEETQADIWNNKVLTEIQTTAVRQNETFSQVQGDNIPQKNADTDVGKTYRDNREKFYDGNEIDVVNNHQLFHYLNQVNQKNLEMQKRLEQIVQNMPQKTLMAIDKKEALRKSLLALKHPEKALSEIEMSSRESLVKTDPKIQSMLCLVEEDIRLLLEEVMAYPGKGQGNMFHITKTDIGELNHFLYERAETSQSFGEETFIVHKEQSIQKEVSEEILQKAIDSYVKSTATAKEGVACLEKISSQEKTAKEEMVRKKTVEITREEIQENSRILMQNMEEMLRTQMDIVSDRVVKDLERRLKNDQRRRGY
ncbi:MAG: hypothetical protein NC307_07895 [Roseburia sp.]|nr:hypothetical protein [Roseburia sp.]